MPRRRRGHRIAARSVLDSPEHGASLTAGRAGMLALRALRTRFADWNAFAVVASEATAAMENSEAGVGILMHFHVRPDEVRRGALNRRSVRKIPVRNPPWLR